MMEFDFQPHLIKKEKTHLQCEEINNELWQQ